MFIICFLRRCLATKYMFNGNINLRELVCNSRNPDPRRVSKGGSELRPMTPFPRIPRIKFRLQNGMSNFVRRRGAREPYLSKPSRPPFKFDALKSRGFVYAKRSFFANSCGFVYARRTFSKKRSAGPTIYTNSRSTALAAVMLIISFPRFLVAASIFQW